MLPPHELKNKEFPKAVRGYSAIDVDEHIDFMIEKYTELYRANDELERRVQVLEADLKEFKVDEESIRSALINAQRASAKIVSEANERADVIIRSSKTNCDKIIAEFNDKITDEREKLITLRKIIAEFKAGLFEQYTSHIEFIDEIAPDVEIDFDTPLEKDEYTKLVVERIKKDISTGVVQEYGNTFNTPVDEPEPEIAEVETALIDTPEEIPAENSAVEDDIDDLDMDDVIAAIPKPEKEAEEDDFAAERDRLAFEAEQLERENRDLEKLEDLHIEEEKNSDEIVEEDPIEEEIVPEVVSGKPLSIKERIRMLNAKIEDESEKPAKEDSDDDDDFDDHFEDFVKTMEVSKKKKNKPHSAD